MCQHFLSLGLPAKTDRLSGLLVAALQGPSSNTTYIRRAAVGPSTASYEYINNMAPITVRDGRDHRLEAGLLSTEEEEKTAFIPAGPQDSQPKRKMSPIRRLAVALIVGLFVGLSIAVAKDSAAARCLGTGHGVSDHEVKVALAKDPSPDLLHRLLHAYFPDRYQHGVYKSDNEAIKAVRADEPGLATTLAGLAKRQSDGSGSNTTSAGGVTVQSTTPTPSSQTKPSDPTTSEFSAAKFVQLH